MVRATSALARPHPAGFVHAVAAAPVSSDPFRLLRAFPSSRRFLWQQPAAGMAIGAVGASVSFRGRGARRFADLAAAVADVTDDEPLPPGVVAVGGFAFDANAREAGPWRGFAPLEWIVPQLALVRRHGRAHLVATAPPGASAGSLATALARARAALDGPDASTAPIPSYHALGSEAALWRRAVEATLDDIAAGRLEKLVLARTCSVRAVAPFDPWRVAARLCRAYPGCTTFAVESGGATFVGATPERLARVTGTRLETAALAGTSPRGSDRALRASPKERAEHAVVVRDIHTRLAPLCDHLVAAPEPRIVATETLQHLRTPIHGRLRGGAGLLDAVAALHPTAAICGTPREAARAVLASRERLSRGWYGGGVGWLDGTGGEVAVAIRTALLRGTHALLHAGAGIVAGSTWEAELEETRLKMRPLLAALLEL
jgi:isochorismate synthase